jgi:hypothetical protein
LSALDIPAGELIAFALAVTSIIAVWTTRGRRGLSLAVASLDLEDDRTGRS